jgi:hypothetical protein
MGRFLSWKCLVRADASQRGVSEMRIEKLAYSIQELSKLSGLGRTFLYDEIKAGRLIVSKAGRRSIVLHGDAANWLAGLPKLPSSATPRGVGE